MSPDDYMNGRQQAFLTRLETAPCETLKISVREQLDEIDHQIETLHESRELLNKLLMI